MLSNLREKALRNVGWSVPHDDVRFIEAFQPRTDGSSTPETFQQGYLRESDIRDWLEQRSNFSQPKQAGPNTTFRGGIRLLFLERKFYRPPSFSISRQCFFDIEKRFCLAPATLGAFSNDAGLYSRFLEYQSNDPTKLKRLCVVIKLCQKYQIGNWALSYSYDFETGFSTGIAHGTGLISKDSDFSLWRKAPFEDMFDLLGTTQHLWSHPLILPTILLQPYVSRLETFCLVDLDDRIIEIQRRLGTSRAGRLYTRDAFQDPVGQKTIHDTKSNLQSLTGEMSTCSTEIFYLSNITDWLYCCNDFLLITSAELRRKGFLDDDTDIKECTEYMKSVIDSVGRSTKAKKDIITSDFSVLNCIISQVDNRLNAKMAASTSRDSTAMKALAFITAIFLPSTAVATIFSMSMFDWQASPHIVSSKFWIFWAVSIPLTVLVAILLRVWWSWEKSNFDKDVLLEINKVDRSAEPDMTRKQ